MMISPNFERAAHDSGTSRGWIVAAFYSFGALGLAAFFSASYAVLKAVFGVKLQYISEFSSMALVAPAIWSIFCSPVYLFSFAAGFNMIFMRTKHVGKAGGSAVCGAFVVSLVVLCLVWMLHGNGPVQVVPPYTP